MQALWCNHLPSPPQTINRRIFPATKVCNNALDRKFWIASADSANRVSFNSKSGLFLGLTFSSISPILFTVKSQQSPGITFDLFRTVHWKQASRSSLLKPCKVTSEDSEKTSSGESIMLNEQTLEHELEIAIKEENYAKAAKIRDSLKFLQEDSKASVLAANARFYNAFRNGNLAAMQSLWSKNDNVCVVHPGVSGISGYDLVMGSWEFVWADYEFPLEIETKDVQAHVKGDVGYVTCIEMVRTRGNSWGRQFATNVFERIDGQWHICVHHASCVDL